MGEIRASIAHIAAMTGQNMELVGQAPQPIGNLTLLVDRVEQFPV